MVEAPPILAYDLLPSGSGITIRRDEHELVIDVPGEPFKFRLRRSLRSPRFWTFVVAIWLSQSWISLWHIYRRGSWLSQPRVLLIVQCSSALLGVFLGLFLRARLHETICL